MTVSLHGRDAERSAVDRLLDGARAGVSGVLVVRGDAGMGKSSLLEYAAQVARGMQVIRARGVENEADLPYASLHMLLRPVLGAIESLPAAQAAALRGALEIGETQPNDRFLVGLALLSVLADLAERAPLLCLIDDLRWLDSASANAVLFAARRLDAEGVAMLMADRGAPESTASADLPELRLSGLDHAAAAALLSRHAPDLAFPVRDRILEEAGGNPLGLIELPRALTAEQRAGLTDLPALDRVRLPLTGRLERAFADRIERLPAPTRSLLLVAASDDSGSLTTVLQAAEALGVSSRDLEPAVRAGLILTSASSIVFSHPLVRAAAYQIASLPQRQAAHRELAAALAAGESADRRTWHLAVAATEPSEEIAAGLDEAARRARIVGGVKAVAAACERAAHLSVDPGRRARRAIAAAEAAVETGELERALRLADTAGIGLGALAEARLAEVRARVEFIRGSPRRANQLRVGAAQSIAGLGARRAASMLVDAIYDAWSAADPELASDAARALAAIDLPAADPVGRLAAAMGSVARWMAGATTGGLEPIRDLVVAGDEAGLDDPRHRFLQAALARMIGDDDRSWRLWSSLSSECRATGRIGELTEVLAHLAEVEMALGRVADARAIALESSRLAADVGDRLGRADRPLAWIAALQGDEERCRALAGEGLALGHRDLVNAESWANYALAMLDLGQGRFEAVRERLEASSRAPRRGLLVTVLFAPDQVEAAVKSGRRDRAREPLDRFLAWSRQVRQAWADAVSERCLAILAEDEAAQDHFLRALGLHERGSRPFERARTELLYGEWLRRRRRRAEARGQLRAARDVFERLGARPWAERAAAELRATGETIASSRDPAAIDQLTPQELQVVRLATFGYTNREIGAQLFLSPRTVGSHLYRAFPKLGVASRGELGRLHLG